MAATRPLVIDDEPGALLMPRSALVPFSIPGIFERARPPLAPPGGSAHLRNDRVLFNRVRGSRKFAPPASDGTPTAISGTPPFSAEAFLPVNWGYPKPNMQETDAHSTGACDCTKHLVLGWEYVRVYIPYVNDASR